MKPQLTAVSSVSGVRNKPGTSPVRIRNAKHYIFKSGKILIPWKSVSLEADIRSVNQEFACFSSCLQEPATGFCCATVEGN
jgi:hypothetical protein